jgi:hypothetical protein
MSILSVQSDGVSPAWAKALAASLPASVRLVETGGDVVLLSGQGDWPARLLAAMQGGQRRFILIDPQAGAAGQLGEVMATGADITLCEIHADNPAVTPFRAGLAGACSTVTITGQGEAPIADLVLQQLRLARATGFAPKAIVHAAADAGQALATLEATYGEASVLLRLNAVQSRAGSGHHRLLTHGRTESACLQVWSDPAARPANAFHIAGDSTTGQPTIYESAHRAVLRAFAPPGGEALREWDHDAHLAIIIAAQV